MTHWISAENLIAMALWWARDRHNDSIEFPRISEYGSKLQKLCNEAGVDVLIRNHSFMEAILESGYNISGGKLNGVMYARTDLSKSELEKIFRLCPIEFLKIMITTSPYGDVVHSRWLNSSVVETSVKCEHCGHHHDLTTDEIRSSTCPDQCPGCGAVMDL